ncbi:MAG: DNA-packaging protein [Vallitalea sp.]|jgi:ACT domain-containing protein|nr:DNA-packaging protein [Vallitalea sp.]
MPDKKFRYKPDALRDKFEEYIDHCRKEGLFPNIRGFTVYAKLSRCTYYEYKNREEFKEATESIEDMLEDETIQQMITARNPAGAIFYAKNKHGYVDKKEIQTNSNTNVLINNASKEELINNIVEKLQLLDNNVIDANCREIEEEQGEE